MGFMGITVYGVAVGMLWYCGYIVAVLMWSPVGLMWNFPWHCSGIAVNLQGDYCDILIVVLLWDCFGIAVILLWHSYDCCWIAIGGAGVLLRCRCGIPMGLMWNLLWLCWGLL